MRKRHEQKGHEAEQNDTMDRNWATDFDGDSSLMNDLLAENGLISSVLPGP